MQCVPYVVRNATGEMSNGSFETRESRALALYAPSQISALLSKRLQLNGFEFGALSCDRLSAKCDFVSVSLSFQRLSSSKQSKYKSCTSKVMQKFTSSLSFLFDLKRMNRFFVKVSLRSSTLKKSRNESRIPLA